MAKKKENLLKLEDHDPLEPITDVTKFGTKDDPCFGQHYDLSTKECKLCGDSELCAIKMAQNLNVTRKQLEEQNDYKDLDVLEDVQGIKKYMRSLIRKGTERKEVISRTVKKFETPKKTIRKIYKELKNNKKE